MRLDIRICRAQRAKQEPEESLAVEVQPDDSLFSLKEMLTMQTNISVVRQRLYSAGKDGSRQLLADDSKTLSACGLSSSSRLILKETGAQISWKGVFAAEYIGPLVIHQLALLLCPLAGDRVWLARQLLSHVAITLHYIKREYETFFVHRFSHATMPLENLFKNCAHYWILGGALMALELYFAAPFYRWNQSRYVMLPLALFGLQLLCEVGNLKCHLMLRDLRPPGSRRRGIPRGFLFDLVSCPNYLLESAGWLMVALLTGCVSAFVFWLVGTVQMYLWAVKKHQAYIKEFPDYPRRRRIMVPFVL